MWVTLIIIAVLLALGVLYLASLDGDYQVRRSLRIDAPPAEVFACIQDFKTWPEWSPWLLHEPDTIITYSDDYQQEGGFYSWDGKLVGVGKLSHLKILPGKSIKQIIEFTRPFKSVNQVNWYIDDIEGSTIVVWEMIGSIPFWFRFMSKNIEARISKDYDLGLLLLKGYLRPDSPHLQIVFSGSESLDNFQYWSVPFSGNLRELQASRKSSLNSLGAAAGASGGLGLTLYNEIDWQQTHYNAEIAMPVAKSSPGSNYTLRQFVGGEYYKVEVGGDYEFLPLAWYAALTHCRMHRIKLDKSRQSLEIYHDNAENLGDSNQATTVLYLPIK